MSTCVLAPETLCLSQPMSTFWCLSSRGCSLLFLPSVCPLYLVCLVPRACPSPHPRRLVFCDACSNLPLCISLSFCSLCPLFVISMAFVFHLFPSLSRLFVLYLNSLSLLVPLPPLLPPFTRFQRTLLVIPRVSVSIHLIFEGIQVTG